MYGQYHLSKFVQFNKGDRNCFLRKIEIFLRGIRKYTKIPLHIKSSYMKSIEKYLLSSHEQFDYIINESCDFYGFRKISKKFGRSKVWAHAHCYVRADWYIDSMYGRIIAVSEFIKAGWLKTSKRLSSDIIVLKNGIEIERFEKNVEEGQLEKLRQEMGVGKDDFIILFCGRIVPQKGIKELLSAVINLGDPLIKLIIVGSPQFALKTNSKYLNEVKQMVNNNKENIRFSGYIDNKDLYKYYALADISVVPSTYEDPAPLVPIESMASGTPMIISNTGGAWEYVDESCAIKVVKEKNFVENLQQAILIFKNDKQRCKRMGISAYERGKLFTAMKYYLNFAELFEGNHEDCL